MTHRPKKIKQRHCGQLLLNYTSLTSPMTDNDPFVTIRSNTGQFYLNSNEKTTQVVVKIPEYDYEEKIGFDPSKAPSIGHEKSSWREDLAEIAAAEPRNLRGPSKQDELSEILDEHGDEIHRKWEQHRANEIDDHIESLKDEKEAL